VARLTQGSSVFALPPAASDRQGPESLIEPVSDRDFIIRRDIGDVVHRFMLPVLPILLARGARAADTVDAATLTTLGNAREGIVRTGAYRTFCTSVPSYLLLTIP
jgi:hypothetical protein